MALRYGPSDESGGIGKGVVELRKRTSGSGTTLFDATFSVPGGPFRYYFDVRDGDQGWWVGSNHHQAPSPLNQSPPALRVFAYSQPEGEVKAGIGPMGYAFSYSGPLTFDVPDWSHDAVWYQIFVDRFRNGDAANDPGQFSAYERLVPWNGDWYATLPGEAAGEENFYEGKGNVWMRRYGGDLQGVREELPYLRKLGINALYLNPIFEAESMHKYDTADYRHVDDNFGVDQAASENHDVYPYTVAGETDDPATWKFSASDKVFLDFIAEAHRQGFKVIADGVFNHVGTGFWAFQDVLKNGKNSKYADWFEVTDWGDGTPGSIQYNAWDKKSGALPVFKKDAKLGLAHGPREHIMAITKRWLDPDGDPATRDGIDGWRLDVPGDIPHPFWKDWREVVKAANPDAYIVGEVWTPAQAWLQGDEFDAVMNYQFAMAGVDFFVDEKTP